MIVSYEIALQHLRASDGTPESDLIKLFIGAASEAACEFLGRKVYEDADALSAAILDGSTGADPILLNDSIRAAVLLILGHLYANREVIEMLTGVVPNDELFGWIWTIDEGDDWTSPKILAKANPNFDISVYADYLISQQQKAIKTARFTNTFKTKHLNVWTTAKEGYFNAESWRACEDRSLSLEQFQGQECVLGFDLARKLDLNSMARLFWRDIDGRRHYYSVEPKFWVPEDTVIDSDNRRMAERYQKWVNTGHLDQTEGAEVDYREILAAAIEANKLAPVIFSPIDPSGATNLSHQLDDEGLSPVTITQNFTNMSDPMKELEAAIMSGRFHHDGNPIMTWCIGNVIGKNLPGNDDVVRPIKQGNDNKIDGAVSLIMAIGRVLMGEPQGNLNDFFNNPVIA